MMNRTFVQSALGLLISFGCTNFSTDAFSFPSTSVVGKSSIRCLPFVQNPSRVASHQCRRTHLHSSISTSPVTSSIEEDGDDEHIETHNSQDTAATQAEHVSPPAPHVIDPDDDLLFTLPRHAANDDVNDILEKTERTIRGLYQHSLKIQERLEVQQIESEESAKSSENVEEVSAGNKPASNFVGDITSGSGADYGHDRVFSNSYVDLGKVDTGECQSKRHMNLYGESFALLLIHTNISFVKCLHFDKCIQSRV